MAGHPPPAMAARPAGASPPALKIKLKRRDPPVFPKVATGSQLLVSVPKHGEPTDSSQQKIAAPPAEDDKLGCLGEESNWTGTHKRKISSPSSSPAHKRFEKEEEAPAVSPVPLSASGEPLEIFPGRSQQLSKDPFVIKHKVGQPHSTVTEIVQREQAVHWRIHPEDEDSRAGKPKASSVILENISHGQFHVITVMPPDQVRSASTSSPVKQDEANQTDFAIGSAMDGATSQQLSTWTLQRPRHQSHDVAIIPKHAGWFSWDRVHKLERQGMPQFFFGKSKLHFPKMYIDVRNSVIAKYRSNPGKALSLADVKGMKNFDDKDLDSLLKFLIHWGLINYQAGSVLEKNELKPQAKFAAYTEEDELGQLRLLATSLEHHESLHQFDTICAPFVARLSLDSADTNSCPSASLSEAVVTEAHIPPESLGSGVTCSVCATSCPQWKYCSEKQADFILCTDCYGDGKFGIGMMASDFILTDAFSEALDSTDVLNWTDQETLMLLEALEIYGENWAEVSEFVGTKTKAQCIQHFIGLTMEDRFLEDMEIPRGFVTAGDQVHESATNTPRPFNSGQQVVDQESTARPLSRDSVQQGEPAVTKAAGSNIHGLRSEEKSMKQLGIQYGSGIAEGELVAFSEAGNPVMALMAFLVAMVGPRVAAAAAHNGLLSLAEDDYAIQSGAKRALAGNLQGQDSLVVSERVQATLNVASETGPAPANIENNIGDEVKEDQVLLSPKRLNDDKGFLSKKAMMKATSASLTAAAVKAKLLADQEEREILRLTAFVVDSQLKKLSLKLKQLGEIDPALEKECEQIERNRQRLSAERTRFVGTRLGPATVPPLVAVSTAASSLNRPTGPIPGPAVPGTILASHSSGMLRPTLFTIGPGGMAVPVSASMDKPLP